MACLAVPRPRPDPASSPDPPQSGDLPGAIEQLLQLEKARRNESDALATAKVCVALVSLCFELKDVRALCANVTLISKRRGQLKQVSLGAPRRRYPLALLSSSGAPSLCFRPGPVF